MEWIKGYKVFNPDWSCRDYHYEVGKIYEEDVVPKCCDRGFHFCKDIADCFRYYFFDPANKVAEVIALGEVDEDVTGHKCCTNKIYIRKEITWENVLKMVNMGIGNTGTGNSGNYNSGGSNSGNLNSGSYNSGSYNDGNYNSGDHNLGDLNTGDWNLTDLSTGCFNTEEAPLIFFNKPSNWTFSRWNDSFAKKILHTMNLEDRQTWWNDLGQIEKDEIKSLPNFDAEIFLEITGINVKSNT